LDERRERRSEPAERLASMTIRRQAELALGLEPRERLELLLHAPRPMRLVRALPDGELYLTVREVGPTDALPLLALSSPDQILHLIDLESWRGDRFDGPRAGAWAAVLLEAGEPALRGLLRKADDSLLALLLHAWLRIRPIEIDDTPAVHGPGESETGDERGHVSPDGYHRFSPVIEDHGPAGRELLRVFFTDQRDRYGRVLWLSHQELPSALEEDALRWRQSRLEERGFLPWREAVEIYAPPSGLRSRLTVEVRADDVLPAPRTALRSLAGRGLLAPALDRLADSHRERAFAELAAVANRVLVADGADTGDPRSHRAAVEKAAGYVSIGLELREAGDPASAATTVDEIPLLELFREGNQAIARVQTRARRLVDAGWAAFHPRALELLDTPLRERIAALLAPRPGYLELAAPEGAPKLRDFRRAAEVEETERAVLVAEAVGRLLVERMELDPAMLSTLDHPRFGTLLLTALAWHATGGVAGFDPLPQETVAAFLRTVASRRTAPAQAPDRAWRSLLSALASLHHLPAEETALLDGFGRACLEQLAAECSSLDPGVPVDPRFVSTLLVRADRQG